MFANKLLVACVCVCVCVGGWVYVSNLSAFQNEGYENKTDKNVSH